LRFFTLYRFQGSVLSSELVHNTTLPIGCQHLFSSFFVFFEKSFVSRTFLLGKTNNALYASEHYHSPSTYQFAISLSLSPLIQIKL